MEDEFCQAVSGRVRRARCALEEALAGVDCFAIAIAFDELGEALELAQEQGVDVPPVETSL